MGLPPPSLDEMSLDEPELIRQGPRFGVRLEGDGPIHPHDSR